MSRRGYKVYGSEHTVLMLSKWAYQVYCDLSPLEIREYEYCKGYYNDFTECYEVIRIYRYDIVGCVEAYCLSDEEVEELLYSLYEEIYKIGEEC